MSKTQKIFCGSGKQKTDNWMKITVNPDKLMEYVQEHEGNRFVKLDINLLPAPNQYGKDIEVTIDTWQPTKSKDKVEVVPDTNNDDLPF